MKKLSTRLASALVVGALAFSGGALAPMVATAQVAGETSTVDLDATVTLTIEKYLGDPGDTSTPQPGFDFTVERIALDNPLNTAAGWQEVSGLTAETATPDGWSTTITTGEDGTITLSTADNPDFGVGVYRITEVQEDGYTVAAPFLVTLPFATAEGWSYDQTVQPKNQTIIAGKTVADREITLGEELRYTITAPVPAGALTRFNVLDPLAGELTYAGAPAVEVLNGQALDLVLDTDYTVTTEGQEVLVTFTGPGRETLQTARVGNPGLAVAVSFDATVNALPADGEIENNATIQLPNGGEIVTAPVDPENPGAPNTGTVTRISTLTVTKQGAELGEDDPDTMEGATFELWRCTEAGDDWELVNGPITASTSATESTLDDSFTTPAGSDGSSAVTLFGVQAYNWVDNAPVDEDYCVVETVAPEGFSLNPEPQPVVFENAADPAAADYRMTATVTNYPDTILGQLPATGGKGVLAILAAGLLFVGGGVWVAKRSNRRGTTA